MTASRREPRILVIRRRYLGDLILLDPFLHNLRDAHPGAWITVVVDEGYGDVLRGCRWIDAIAELPRRGSLARRLRGWRAFLAEIATKPFDLAFDFSRNERAALTLLLARARRRVAHDVVDDASVRRRRRSDALRRRLLATDLVRSTRAEQVTVHSVDWSNRLLAPVGVPAAHRVPALAVPDADRREARALVERLLGRRDQKRPLVLLHPGGRWKAKLWPAERFAALADALQELGCDTLLTAGPGESALVRSVAEARTRPGGAVLDAPASLGTLYAILAECDLFVGNDSGPAHMAAAVGTPACVLFGATRPVMWRTLGPHDEALEPDLPCGDACVRPDACTPQSRFCVRRIPVEEVVAAARRILARARSESAPARAREEAH